MAKYFYILQSSSSKHIRNSRVFYVTSKRRLYEFFLKYCDLDLFRYWRVFVYDRKDGVLNVPLTKSCTSKLSSFRTSVYSRFKF